MLRSAIEVGKEAALAAAALLRECYRVRAEARANAAAASGAGLASGASSREEKALLEIEEKSGDTDLVTRYDKLAEDTIIAILTEKTPSFRLISEERNPEVALTDEPTWIIDPIDGTMDFVHGLMDCCVSIGLAFRGRPALGVVHCPFVGPTEAGELIYGGAALGGAWLNGRKLHPLPKVEDMSKTIVSLNMPWRHSEEAVEAATSIRRDLLQTHRVRGIRMYGASVFQMAQVALGRVDGYSEPGGKIWDVAAGAALIEAVGGSVYNLEGGPFALEDHTITCAASEAVAGVMAGLCKQHEFRRRYWV